MFGFPTHKYKAKHDLKAHPGAHHASLHVPDQPSDFIRKLFFREKHYSRHSSSADRGLRDRLRRPGSGHAPRRSSTLPITSHSDPQNPLVTPLPSPIHTRESTLDSQTDATSVASSRRVPTSPTSTLRMRPQAPRMQSEPVNVRKYTDVHPVPIPVTDAHSNSHATAIQLPKALVVSGLEHVEIPAQRILLRVLQDRKIVLDSHSLDLSSGLEGTWSLPSDFFSTLR